MQVIICQKHKKKQKLYSRILTASNVCLNRHCQNSYIIICPLCRTQHRDHSIKVLTLEDVAVMIKKHLKIPISERKYINQTIDILKKLKLIKQFRRKIDILENDIVKQSSIYVELTQFLLNSQRQSRENIIKLSQKLNDLQKIQNYNQFKNLCKQYFCHIDYNFKREKIQPNNTLTKQKQDQRKKLLELTKRKIQEVKDYSMKIIQVILNNDDSDSEDEVTHLTVKNKIYLNLKKQLSLGLKQQEDTQDHQEKDQDKSKTTTGSHTINGHLIQPKKQTTYTQQKGKSAKKEQTAKLLKDLDYLKQQLDHSKLEIINLKQQGNKNKLQLTTTKKHLQKVKIQHDKIEQQYRSQITKLKKQYDTLKKQYDVHKKQTQYMKKQYTDMKKDSCILNKIKKENQSLSKLKKENDNLKNNIEEMKIGSQKLIKDNQFIKSQLDQFSKANQQLTIVQKQYDALIQQMNTIKSSNNVVSKTDQQLFEKYRQQNEILKFENNHFKKQKITSQRHINSCKNQLKNQRQFYKRFLLRLADVQGKKLVKQQQKQEIYQKIIEIHKGR